MKSKYYFTKLRSLIYGWKDFFEKSITKDLQGIRTFMFSLHQTEYLIIMLKKFLKQFLSSKLDRE